MIKYFKLEEKGNGKKEEILGIDFTVFFTKKDECGYNTNQMHQPEAECPVFFSYYILFILTY